MNQRHPSWARAIGTLAALGIMAGAMIALPVGAGTGLTEAKVKKIAKKQATRVLERASHTYELRLVGPFKMNTTAEINLDDPASLMASLPVGPGSYVISATLTLTHAPGVNVDCQLRAGQESDGAHAYSGAGLVTEPLVMGLAHTFPDPGVVELRCDDTTPADDGGVSEIEILATRTVRLTELPG